MSALDGAQTVTPVDLLVCAVERGADTVHAAGHRSAVGGLHGPRGIADPLANRLIAETLVPQHTHAMVTQCVRALAFSQPYAGPRGGLAQPGVVAGQCPGLRVLDDPAGAPAWVGEDPAVPHGPARQVLGEPEREPLRHRHRADGAAVLGGHADRLVAVQLATPKLLPELNPYPPGGVLVGREGGEPGELRGQWRGHVPAGPYEVLLAQP